MNTVNSPRNGQPLDRLLQICGNGSMNPSLMSCNKDRIRSIAPNKLGCSSMHSLIVGNKLCTVVANSINLSTTLSNSKSRFSSIVSFLRLTSSDMTRSRPTYGSPVASRCQIRHT